MSTEWFSRCQQHVVRAPHCREEKNDLVVPVNQDSRCGQYNLLDYPRGNSLRGIRKLKMLLGDPDLGCANVNKRN